MKKVILSLSALMLFSLTASASSELSEQNSLVVYLVIPLVGLGILWLIINSATKADRIYKAQLMQIAIQKRILDNTLNSEVTDNELADIAEKISNIDLKGSRSV